MLSGNAGADRSFIGKKYHPNSPPWTFLCWVGVLVTMMLDFLTKHSTREEAKISVTWARCEATITKIITMAMPYHQPSYFHSSLPSELPSNLLSDLLSWISCQTISQNLQLGHLYCWAISKKQSLVKCCIKSSYFKNYLKQLSWGSIEAEQWKVHRIWGSCQVRIIVLGAIVGKWNGVGATLYKGPLYVLHKPQCLCSTPPWCNLTI